LSSDTHKGSPFKQHASRSEFEDEFGWYGNVDGGYQDDRVENILLDEIYSDFGIKDANDIDLLDLDSVKPPMTRLPDNLGELDQTIPFGRMDEEMELMKTRAPLSGHSNGERKQVKSRQTKGRQDSRSAQDLLNVINSVASPTISSTCESVVSRVTGPSGGVRTKEQPPDSTSGQTCVNGGSSGGVIHNTSSSSGLSAGQGVQSPPDRLGDVRVTRVNIEYNGKQESLKTDKLKNVPKVEGGVVSCGPQGVAGQSVLSTVMDVSSRTTTENGEGATSHRRVPNFSVTRGSHSEADNMFPRDHCHPSAGGKQEGVLTSTGGGDSCSTSASTSPSVMHVAKRPRTINSGSELLQEVRESFAYVHGADLWAPTTHATFSDPSGGVTVPLYGSQTNQRGCVTGREMHVVPSSPHPMYSYDHQLRPPSGHPDLNTDQSRPPSGHYSSALVQPRPPSGHYNAATVETRPPSGHYESYEQRTLGIAPCGFIRNDNMSGGQPMKRRMDGSPSVAGRSDSRQPMGQFVGGAMNEAGQMGNRTMCAASSYVENFNNPTSQTVHEDQPYNQSHPPGVDRSLPPGRSKQGGVRSIEDQIPQPPSPSNSSRSTSSRGGRRTVGGTKAPQQDPHGVPLSEHTFLRHIIGGGDDSKAYKDHPIYPLLRDLIIADMNFHTPSFPFALISNLPVDLHRLLANYRARTPNVPLDHPDPTIQQVVMDAVQFAHKALIGGFCLHTCTVILYVDIQFIH